MNKIIYSILISLCNDPVDNIRLTACKALGAVSPKFKDIVIY